MIIYACIGPLCLFSIHGIIDWWAQDVAFGRSRVCLGGKEGAAMIDKASVSVLKLYRDCMRLAAHLGSKVRCHGLGWGGTGITLKGGGVQRAPARKGGIEGMGEALRIGGRKEPVAAWQPGALLCGLRLE